MNISASVTLINPNLLNSTQFKELDKNIISSFITSSQFNPVKDKVEYFIYDSSYSLITQVNNYSSWSVNDTSIIKDSNVGFINIDPLKDVEEYGFDRGEINTVYNFVSYKLGSSPEIKYYLDEISSDRTELRLKSNFITDISSSYFSFKDEQTSSSYFDEFYLNFGNNNYFIGVNLLLDSSSLLVKLYEPLPIQYNVKDEVFIFNKTAESLAYNIKFISPNIELDKLVSLKGPNVNLNISNQIGSSTIYSNYNSLISSPLTSSYYQLQNLLKKEGIFLSPDYTDFSDFIHFSSLKQRLLNFYTKISNIESYNNEINNLLLITGSTSSSVAISSSVSILNNKIEDIISNFDGYDYYLYYESNSYAWPKSNSSIPYTLYSTSSIQGLTWLGSDDINSIYYGGILYSASLYDNSNQDNLIYLIPEFIRDEEDNNNYILFTNMVGQFYDYLWLYIKEVTKRLKADNRLLYGISKDLVADTLKSLGTKIYNNNYSIYNLYSSLLGLDASGSYLPPTGSDYITDYIAVNSGSDGYPYSIEDINKEIYKRLYHNISYILKKKGTIQGLRELINIYGIPNTILRINEFGGKNKEFNNWDYWHNIYNYAYTKNRSLDYLYIPFPNLTTTINRPQSILCRVKFPTFFTDTGSSYSQSIYQRGNPSSAYLGFALVAEYTGSGLISSSAYSGSINDPFYQYGTIKFIVSGSGGPYSASVYLPIFDGDWWSIMVNHNSSSIDLYVKNKQYIGDDGSILGYQASSSITTANTGGWEGTTVNGLVRIGRGNMTFAGKTYKDLSGSMQEFRYYSVPLNGNAFNSYVMNPLSIEGNMVTGSESAYNILKFRAPLGADLQYKFDVISDDPAAFSGFSVHPSVTGSNPTASYPTAGGFWTASEYKIYASGSSGYSFQPNVEYIFLREEISGIRNRVSNKIKNERPIVPEGDTVSSQISIQQNPVFSGSYSPNINTLEVVFSPQNEINDDITDQLGEFNIGNFIGDPRHVSSSLTYYPDLKKLGESYFKKYIHNYRIWDYIRLIKYFDNSLFKIIQDFIPAKTSLISGILIKQHLLERNKYPLPQVNISTSFAYVVSSSTYNIPYGNKDISLTASIKSIPGLLDGQKIYTSSTDFNHYPLEELSGGTGGIMPNLLRESQSYNNLITQSWQGINDTIAGLVPYTHSSQIEFFDGEFSGSLKKVVTQSLNSKCDPLLSVDPTEILYRPVLFRTSNIAIDFFLNPASSPDSGEIYLLYDIGSILGYYSSK